MSYAPAVDAYGFEIPTYRIQENPETRQLYLEPTNQAAREVNERVIAKERSTRCEGVLPIA